MIIISHPQDILYTHLPCLDNGSKMAVSISSNVMTLRSVNTSIILNGMATDWYELLCSTLHIE